MSVGTEFYKLIKDKPEWVEGLSFDKQSRATQQFYLWELKKIREGITIAGVKIHPWLYWHLNFWNISQAVRGDDGLITSVIDNPVLRDNELFFNENILRAEEEPKKGLMIYGSRRGGKSVSISSWTMWNAMTKYVGPSFGNVIIGGSTEDLGAITTYMDSGYEYLHPMFKINRITKDWYSKLGVLFGVKMKNNENDVFSRVNVINLDMGNSSSNQKTAGGTPISWVLDEALKYDTPVLTTDGFKPIEKIRSGEWVYGGDGRVTTVIEKVDVGKKQLHKFTFENNIEIESCEDHKWRMYDKTLSKEVEVTTKYINENFSKDRFYIPINKPLIFEEGDYEENLEELRNMTDIYGANIGNECFVLYSNSKIDFKRAIELVRHLGYYNKIVDRGNGRYKLLFKTNDNIYRNERKALRQPVFKDFDIKYVELLSTEPTSVEQAYCLRVDNDDHEFLIDGYLPTKNCGKFRFLKSWQTAKASFDTGLGTWRLSPWILGTSGNLDYSEDSMALLNNPETHNLVTMDWSLIERHNPNPTWERKEFALFIPGQMSLAVTKVDSNLADYYGIDDSYLRKINIKVTPWEEANREMTEKLANLKKRDKDSYYNQRMFYPLDPNDCFLQDGYNPFPTTEALIHKADIEQRGDDGKRVELYIDPTSNVIEYKLSEKELPVFPHPGGNIDAPYLLFEDPPDPSERDINKVFCGGLDHYKHDTSSGDSLGAFYIVKRKTHVFDSTKIAACYVSRPNTMDIFNRNVELLMKMYGAEVLQENADISFQQYLMRKGEVDRWLVNGEELARKLIRANAFQHNKFGLTANEKNKKYVLDLVINYCWEVLEDGEDEDGVKITKYGVTRIKDVRLLDEILNYKKGGNFDRILAFGYALAWVQYLDDMGVPTKSSSQKMSDFQNELRKAQSYSKSRSFYSTKSRGFYR